MAVQYNPGIVTDGLVLCLDAANRKSYPGSGVTWGDLSGIGNNGTLNSGATFNPTQSGSIYFDGTDDNVSFANTNVGEFASANFSLGAWFYYTGISQDGSILGKRDAAPNYNQYGMTITADAVNGGNGTKFTCFINPDGTYDGANTAAFSVELGTNPRWCFGMLSVSTTVQRMYLNGINVSNSFKDYTTKTFLIPNRPLYVGGRWNSGFSAPFKSNFISVVQLYARALSASEVLQNFNALRGRFGI